MKILLILIFFLLILLFINKSKFKVDMDKDLYSIAYELGINYLNTVKFDNKSTVMFDIDDTLLYVLDKPNTFKPIKPMIRLLNECRRRGLIILIITARSNKFTAETKKDLKKYNIYYDYLYLRVSPKDDHQIFKSDIKKIFLEKHQIKTIMSVGDNEIDIVGDYSGDFSIKLPNRTDPNLYQLSYGKLENIVP